MRTETLIGPVPIYVQGVRAEYLIEKVWRKGKPCTYAFAVTVPGGESVGVDGFPSCSEALTAVKQALLEVE